MTNTYRFNPGACWQYYGMPTSPTIPGTGFLPGNSIPTKKICTELHVEYLREEGLDLSELRLNADVKAEEGESEAAGEPPQVVDHS